MNMRQPLVSINITTYNSSKFIIETLESAKMQTYQNIELIVSDDSSVDNTVELCRKWIEKNRERFVRCKVITVEKNTGIAANCNRAMNASNGEWIKELAGDDIFLPNCVEDNINYVMAHPEINILFSNMIHFNDTFCQQNIVNNATLHKKLNIFFSMGSEGQLKMIINGNFLPAPTLFHKNGFLNSFGGYNENYGYEDWPMWITLLEKGERLYSFGATTIAYRHHFESLSTHKDTLFNIRHINWRMEIMRDMCFKYYTKNRICFEKIEYRFNLIILKLNLNHANCISTILYKFVLKRLAFLM